MLSGCSSIMSANTYKDISTQKILSFSDGTVVDVRKITIEPSATGFGAIIGGVLGGLTTSHMSKNSSSSGQTLVTAIGATVGFLAGNAIEKLSGTKEGLELLIKLNSGKKFVIIQDAEVPFSIGQRIRVLHDMKSIRVVPVETTESDASTPRKTLENI